MRLSSVSIVCIMIAVTLIACGADQASKQSVSYLTSVVWVKKDGEIYFKGGKVLQKSRYDSELESMVGDTVLPLVVTDSTVAFTKIQGLYRRSTETNEYEIVGDTIFIDTLIYDFAIIDDLTHLLLYSDTYLTILRAESKNVDIPESNNFRNTDFSVSGYSIGDTIDLDIIEITSSYNLASTSLRQAHLLSDKDLSFKIIGRNTIYNINRSGIDAIEIDNIISVVGNKLNQEPKYKAPERSSKTLECEYYSWQKRGVRITLQRCKYKGSDSLTKALSKYDWTLYYSDDIQEMLLAYIYRDTDPKSKIIQ